MSAAEDGYGGFDAVPPMNRHDLSSHHALLLQCVAESLGLPLEVGEADLTLAVDQRRSVRVSCHQRWQTKSTGLQIANDLPGSTARAMRQEE